MLAGDAQALDITPSICGSPNPTFNTMVRSNLTDPDSEETDPSGNLVLDSQADGKLVFINNPGAPNQTASVLTLTLFNDKDGPVTPVDDTRFVPKAGPQGVTIVLFTDKNNSTYRVDSQFFTPGDAYSCAQGRVVKLDESTGHLTRSPRVSPIRAHYMTHMAVHSILSIRSVITCRKPTVTTGRRRWPAMATLFCCPPRPHWSYVKFRSPIPTT